MALTELYIGLLSGTSADAVDAALVDFSKTFPQLIAVHSLPLSVALQNRLYQLNSSRAVSLSELGRLDVELGELFAEAVLVMLSKEGISSEQISAIGSHGQTVWHQPQGDHPFSLQLADPNIIAARTGIPTVADFRRKDIALGGQGAPLTPAFHAEFYRHQHRDRVVLNLGGIANITYLPAGSDQIIGFDTGPANTLLDVWYRLHQAGSYDEAGQWAATGKVIETLLAMCLDDWYFTLPYPKSTGREHFNLTWLQNLNVNSYQPADVQATLVELTVVSIVKAIQQLTQQAEVLIAGGGAHNNYLMQRLAEQLAPHYVCQSIDRFGIDADWVEAVAFAWFAKKNIKQEPVNLHAVTGAAIPAILGGFFSK